MKINRKKLELAEARACMGQKKIVAAGFPASTYIAVKKRKTLPRKQSEDLLKFLGLMS